MKLSIERAALLRCMSHVQNVVERRNTIPILANVLIRVEGGEATVTATDLDMDIVERVPARVLTPGVTTVKAHRVYEILRTLPDGCEVELDGTVENERLRLRAGRSVFSLGTLAVSDFPQIQSEGLPHRFALPALRLRTLIDRARFAISTEETRYYLNGIHLHAAGEKLRAVATDGHRLARIEVPLPEGAEGIPGVILPRKTVTELRKLLDEFEEDVRIELSETRVRAHVGDLTLSSKLIDGTFPDYERVIPTGNERVLCVDSGEAKQAVARVATISNEKARAVKLAMTENLLTLSATSGDADTATDEVEVEYSAAPMEIGFNSRYLTEILDQIADTAEFAMADAASPTVVRPKGDDEALFVLMPMRV
jgi:DNA polymerase-3 subunit beta